MATDRQRSLERKRRILELLDAALELPQAKRRTFLEQTCDDDRLRRQVQDMLDDGDSPATTGRGALLEEPIFDIHEAELDLQGRQMGPYRLVRLLARGGMGSVYLAERDDFDKKVAFKIIRSGLDLDEVALRRFHNERQILARLDHTHIAGLLDGGTTPDALPYFVMEYVEGEQIDHFVSQHQLSIEERLRLFLKVCDAVQFAHQNLVIHRDLKPSNMLVLPSGEPKLLDFGIAKLLDEGLAREPLLTATGEGPMTPRYASPEQIRMQPITTASDVYSLGVVLYEMLTGLPPYRLADLRGHEVARAVCEQEPERPSTAVRKRAAEFSSKPETHPAGTLQQLRRRLAGDLDSIVLKALRKEPGERYGSVEQLALDLQRHLDGLPVLAQTSTFVYRTGKFVRRHRVGLIVGLMFILISGGLAYYQQQAALADERADEARERTANTVRFLKSLFQAANPNIAGSADVSADDILRYGKDRVITDFENDPKLRMEFAGVLGDLFRIHGSFEESHQVMHSALEAALEAFGSPHPEVAKRLNNLAVSLFEQGEYSVAELRYREVLEMRRELGLDRAKTFRARSNLATCLSLQGKFDEAEEIHLEVLRQRQELYLPKYGPNDLDIARSHHNLAVFEYARGNLDDAEAYVRQALRARIAEDGPDKTTTASSLDLFGRIQSQRGRAAEDLVLSIEAERSLTEALEIRRQLLGPGHRRFAESQLHLAEHLLDTAPETAAVLAERALTIFTRHNAEGWRAAAAESLLGTLLAQRGDLPAAITCLEAGHRRLEEIRGSKATDTLRAYARWQEVADRTGGLSR